MPRRVFTDSQQRRKLAPEAGTARAVVSRLMQCLLPTPLWVTLAFMASFGSQAMADTGAVDRPASDVVSMPVSYSDVAALMLDAYSMPVLRYGPGDDMTVAHFAPMQQSAKNPLVLIHGGCWASAYTREHIFPLAQALAESGFDVWVPEYRRTGQQGGGWPGTFEDVVAAIEFVSAQVEHSPLWLVGHSAGGHLALLAASDGELPAKVQLRGAIGLAAITDLTRYAATDNSCGALTEPFMGVAPDTSATIYQHASPASREQQTPITLVQGDVDTIVPAEQHTAMREANSVIVAGAGHFDLIHPKTPAFTALMSILTGAEQ